MSPLDDILDSTPNLQALPAKLRDSIKSLVTSVTDAVTGKIHDEVVPPPFTMPPPPPPASATATTAPGWINRLLGAKIWISENKRKAFVFVVVAGVGVYILSSTLISRRRKRRVMKATATGPSRREAIVVTNSHSSVMAPVLMYFRRKGYTVYATVPNAELAKSLDRMTLSSINDDSQGSIVPLVFDKENAESMQAAIDHIQSQPEASLVGVINSSTECIPAPLESLELAQWRANFDENVLYNIAIIKQCLPLLRQRPDRTVRILFISRSPASPVPLPFLSPAAATDYALEAIANSLRRELVGSGIKIICLKPKFPGGFEQLALIHDNQEREVLSRVNSWSPALRATYGDAYNAFLHSGYDRLYKFSRIRQSFLHRHRYALEEALSDALTLEYPSDTIMYGDSNHFNPLIDRWVPDWMSSWVKPKTRRDQLSSMSASSTLMSPEAIQDDDLGFEKI
ncbi:hypothetical protein BZG36_03282 [Bifiguratus adelaidae]|uniref:DUF1776-domain-containing protein n=1 Tax=Bifiguratus adelaidae TaxID=1938954 RepID=A0A261XZW1_9FUNG|nr:hypothetical protein BZG36_03282 [Bifiguratus adelaidae]